VGMGAGIIPDRLDFNSEHDLKTFRILNPNKAEMEFSIRSDNINCSPLEGRIDTQSETEISCKAMSGAAGEDLILVETSIKGGERIGVMPAVAVKATIKGKPTQPYEDATENNSPLSIDNSQNIPPPPEKELGSITGGDLWTIKWELVTIAVLIFAIISVMLYPEVKKLREKRRMNRKKKIEKKKTETLNGCSAASSISSAQDGRSSASGEASPDQLLRSLSHAWKAQSQQTSRPSRSP